MQINNTQTNNKQINVQVGSWNLRCIYGWSTCMKSITHRLFANDMVSLIDPMNNAKGV